MVTVSRNCRALFQTQLRLLPAQQGLILHLANVIKRYGKACPISKGTLF